MASKNSKIPNKITYVHEVNAIKTSVGSWHDRGNNIISVHFSTVFSGLVQNARVTASQTKVCHTVDNLPIKNVKIINSRWALIDDKYAVDIDQDLLTDAMVNSKIDKGKIHGEFIWIRSGSKARLIRINSGMHTKIINSERRSALPKIKKKNLQVGAVYCTPSGVKEVYLGKVDTERHVYDYRTKSHSKIEVKNKCLFYKIRENLESFNPEEIKEGNVYKLSVKDNHSFVEMVGHLNLDADIIKQIREGSIKRMKEFVISNSKSQESRRWIESEYRYNSVLINLKMAGEALKENFNIDKYMTFM
jgi:hypothetical protein